MAFCTKESLPERIPRLFEDTSQENTSAVSHCLYKARTYFTASMVFLELSVTCPASSCSAPPKDHRMARTAMLVSFSCERPRPHGLPNFSLIRRPPTRRSLYVSGPCGKPTCDQRSFR